MNQSLNAYIPFARTGFQNHITHSLLTTIQLLSFPLLKSIICPKLNVLQIELICPPNMLAFRLPSSVTHHHCPLNHLGVILNSSLIPCLSACFSCWGHSETHVQCSFLTHSLICCGWVIGVLMAFPVCMHYSQSNFPTSTEISSV